MGLLTVGHDWATSLSLFIFMHWRRKWQPTPGVLPGQSQGQGSLVGCRLWGHAESDTTEATQQQQQQPLCTKYYAGTAAKSRQSCPTLCDPIDSSPPGFPIPGILQARTLEWVAISFSNAWKWSHSVVFNSAIPRTAAYQAPPSMEVSRQEYWSGSPVPSPNAGTR